MNVGVVRVYCRRRRILWSSLVLLEYAIAVAEYCQIPSLLSFTVDVVRVHHRKISSSSSSSNIVIECWCYCSALSSLSNIVSSFVVKHTVVTITIIGTTVDCHRRISPLSPMLIFDAIVVIDNVVRICRCPHHRRHCRLHELFVGYRRNRLYLRESYIVIISILVGHRRYHRVVPSVPIDYGRIVPYFLSRFCQVPYRHNQKPRRIVPFIPVNYRQIVPFAWVVLVRVLHWQNEGCFE